MRWMYVHTQWERLEAVMTAMAAAGRPPTASMYGKVLDVYQTGERWERVEAVVSSMQAVGLRPAVDTFVALLNAYESGDQVSQAWVACSPQAIARDVGSSYPEI